MLGNLATRANALTLLRLLLAPVLVCSVLAGAAVVAACCVGLAVATDLADGWLARRHGEATPLGGAIDHAVDATFVTCGTGALAWGGVLPALLPALIAIAFLEYALDARWFESRGLRASSLGRWNGIAYYGIVGIPVVRDALALGWPAPGWVRGLGWLLVVATAVSILDRLRVALRAGRSPKSKTYT